MMTTTPVPLSVVVVGSGNVGTTVATNLRSLGHHVRVVKASNVLGAEHMAAPPLPGGHRPLLPVAADDDSAHHLVAPVS